MELVKKYSINLTDQEIEMIKEAEDRFNGINDMSRHSEREENFSELPPVVVMNKTDSPPRSPRENGF